MILVNSKLKEFMQKTSDSNYVETRKMYVLRIRVSITVRITKYFEHHPRTILGTLWKKVCIIWKVLRINKQLTSLLIQKNSKTN